jgi:hypothetical protein
MQTQITDSGVRNPTEAHISTSLKSLKGYACTALNEKWKRGYEC